MSSGAYGRELVDGQPRACAQQFVRRVADMGVQIVPTSQSRSSDPGQPGLKEGEASAEGRAVTTRGAGRVTGRLTNGPSVLRAACGGAGSYGEPTQRTAATAAGW